MLFIFMWCAFIYIYFLCVTYKRDHQDHTDKEKAYHTAMSNISNAHLISAVAAKNIAFSHHSAHHPHFQQTAAAAPPSSHLPYPAVRGDRFKHYDFIVVGFFFRLLF